MVTLTPLTNRGVTLTPLGPQGRPGPLEPRPELAVEVEQPGQVPERSSLSVFGESLVSGVLNSIIAVPSAVADALRVNPIADVASIARGEAPKQVLGTTPRATVTDIGAGVRSLAGDEDFATAKAALEQAQKKQAEEFPVATLLGQVGGDIASLALGRAALGLKAGAKAASSRAGGLEGVTVRALNKIKRGTGKALGVGIEGAALATLGEGDPVKAAALAGGGQAAGSLALTVAKIPTTGTGLAVTAAGLVALIQTFKSMTPGGRDRILESAETAFEKIGIGMTVGAAAGLAGAGRLRGSQLSTRAPRVMDRLADAINTGLRGPWVSFWSDFRKNEAEIERLEPALNAMVNSPESFTPAEQRRLERSIKNGKLSKELDQLSKNPKFREKLEELAVPSPAALGVRG